MPLYEYECVSCAARFERIQRFSDPPVEACPTCGAAVRKLISSPAIQFKGSGWYVTDYARKAGSSKDADARAPDAAAADSKGAESSKPGADSGAAEGKPSSKEATAPAPSKPAKASDPS